MNANAQQLGEWYAMKESDVAHWVEPGAARTVCGLIESSDVLGEALRDTRLELAKKCDWCKALIAKRSEEPETRPEDSRVEKAGWYLVDGGRVAHWFDPGTLDSACEGWPNYRAIQIANDSTRCIQCTSQLAREDRLPVGGAS